MSKKVFSNSLVEKKYKKKFKKNLSFDNIDLKDIGIDDLKLNKNESNFENYFQLKYFLDSVSSCQLSDAYLNITKKSPVIANLKSINNYKTYGKIITSVTDSADWGTSALAIDIAKKDDILFIKVNDDKQAIWGEIASRAAMEKEIKASVIYGSCRDVDILSKINFPVFALNFVPNAGSPLGLGDVDKEIYIQDRKISTGDFFFGDINGSILIEKNLFKKVILETLSIKTKEFEFISSIKDNITLSQLVNLK